MAKRKQTKPRKPSKSPSRRARGELWFLAIAAGVLAIGATLLLKPSAKAPEPPAIDLAGFDPAVAQLLEERLANVRQQPTSSQAWGNLGLALQNYERHDQARHCLEQAARLAPEEPRWPFYLGILALPTPLAVTYLERASRLAGASSDSPNLRLAQTLAEHGRLVEAATVYSNLLARQPQHAAAQLSLARVQLAQTQLTQAAETVRPALTDPRTAQGAYQLLAAIQLRLGNGEAAERARRIASSLPPDQRWPDPYASEAGRWRTGEQARVDHGQQLLLQGKLSDALLEAKRVLEAYPRSAEGWLLLARARFQNQDCPGAEAALRQHLQINPASVNGLTQLGIALLCQERYAEAASAFTAALQHKPDLGQAYFNLGYSRAKLGEVQGAIAAFENAIRRNPDFTEAYVALGDLCMRAGDSARAQALFEQARALRPGEGTELPQDLDYVP